jgi:hypothetical protein
MELNLVKVTRHTLDYKRLSIIDRFRDR